MVWEIERNDTVTITTLFDIGLMVWEIERNDTVTITTLFDIGFGMGNRKEYPQ